MSDGPKGDADRRRNTQNGVSMTEQGPGREHEMRLTAREAEQLEAVLDAEPRVIPELAALIREVNGQRS